VRLPCLHLTCEGDDCGSMAECKVCDEGRLHVFTANCVKVNKANDKLHQPAAPEQIAPATTTGTTTGDLQGAAAERSATAPPAQEEDEEEDDDDDDEEDEDDEDDDQDADDEDQSVDPAANEDNTTAPTFMGIGQSPSSRKAVSEMRAKRLQELDASTSAYVAKRLFAGVVAHIFVPRLLAQLRAMAALPVPEHAPPEKPVAKKRRRRQASETAAAASSAAAGPADDCLSSYATFQLVDGYQMWPFDLPPARMLASSGLKHRGGDILVCTLCGVDIPLECFQEHDSVANAHHRATGTICAPGTRIRKRKPAYGDQAGDQEVQAFMDTAA
jgi:hypothetical protein